MSINNSQLPNFTEHIKSAPGLLPIELYIKFCKAHPQHRKEKRYTPQRTTSKAIVGIDIIKVPSCMTEYWPEPTESTKKCVRERDNYTCQLCGKPDSKVVDHIIPLRISHDSSESNLRVVCCKCNTVNRLQRRDARLEYDEWIKLLRESLMPPVTKQ